MLELTAIRLANIRVFEGDHVLPVHPRLTVLMGRNNAGKSTVLRAPFLFLHNNAGRSPWPDYHRDPATHADVALQFKVPADELERRVGFPVARVTNDVRIEGSGAPMQPLTSFTPFAQWAERPVVELGWRVAPHPKRNIARTTRLVGSDRTSFLEITNQGPTVTVNIEGRTRTSSAVNDWFERSFATLETAVEPSLTGLTFAHWEHHRVSAASGWMDQGSRRVLDYTDEKRLLEVLTFLRLKEPKEFERVATALHTAFPEFARLDFIDVNGSGFDYRPGFQVAGRRVPLSREQVGSGAWTYLCVIAAARAAKATNARILALDEPHIYLHPGLERRLIDDLVDEESWDGTPLQIIAATHSPTFVNAAVTAGVLNVLDWEDEPRSRARVASVSVGDNAHALLSSLGLEPGDLLYAERAIFVEGPSDIIALQLLLRMRCSPKHPVRFVPLGETDTIAANIARYFRILVQAHGAGLRTRALLLLDGDKRANLEKAWDKLDQAADPRKASGLDVVWSDARGNDLESVFCDLEFLTEYFVGRGVDAAAARGALEPALKSLAFPATRKAEKGCVAIRTVTAQLMGENDSGLTKADDLECLMAYFVENADMSFASEVAKRIAPLERALRGLAG